MIGLSFPQCAPAPTMSFSRPQCPFLTLHVCTLLRICSVQRAIHLASVAHYAACVCNSSHGCARICVDTTVLVLPRAWARARAFALHARTHKTATARTRPCATLCKQLFMRNVFVAVADCTSYVLYTFAGYRRSESWIGYCTTSHTTEQCSHMLTRRKFH